MQIAQCQTRIKTSKTINRHLCWSAAAVGDDSDEEAAAQLDSLPKEILQEVLHDLDPASLASMACCSRCRRLVQLSLHVRCRTAMRDAAPAAFAGSGMHSPAATRSGSSGVTRCSSCRVLQHWGLGQSAQQRNGTGHSERTFKASVARPGNLRQACQFLLSRLLIICLTTLHCSACLQRRRPPVLSGPHIVY